MNGKRVNARTTGCGNSFCQSLACLCLSPSPLSVPCLQHPRALPSSCSQIDRTCTCAPIPLHPPSTRSAQHLPKIRLGFLVPVYQKKISGSLWVPLGLSGSLWVPLGPSGSRWAPLVPSASLWVPLGTSGYLWVPLGPSGSLWVPLGPSESLWVPLGPSGSLWAPLGICKRLAKSVQKTRQKLPGTQKSAQDLPKSSQRVPKGTQNLPKGSPKCPKGVLRGA